VGEVDYRLLTRFVRSRREHADERAGKRDVEVLLTLLDQRVRPADAERRSPAQPESGQPKPR
jgi:hypothetical protein